VFSFGGLVVGSVIYSMPFVVQPLVGAFAAVSKAELEAAASLGASPVDRVFSVILPSSRAGLIVASVLGFAHTLGEFGVVLMIGGNIPSRTRVLSIAIYEHVEARDYAQAHLLSAGLVAFSLLVLLVVYARSGRAGVWSR
jgi:molybdate transport system permease protein